MSEINTDYELEPDCEDCQSDEDCYDPSCLVRLFVGPCNAYNKTTGEVDMSLVCVAPTATAHTPNFLHPFIERERRNRCGMTRVPGMADCNIAVSFDICHEEPTMKHLLNTCPITLMVVPRIDLFDITAPQASQGLAIMRGNFIGADWNWENEFSSIQQTSRTFSSSGDKVRGVQDWLATLPEIAPAKVNPALLLSKRREAKTAIAA